MECTIELLGTPRRLMQASEVKLKLSPGASLGDLLTTLVQKEARLLESVVAADMKSLNWPYRFYREGSGFVDDLSQKVEPGDRLILLPVTVGG